MMENKEETIRHMTRRLKRIINKHMRIEKLPVPISDNISLSPGEVRSIQMIGHNEGVNVNMLGKLMGVTRSAASQMVGKLVEKGVTKKQFSEYNKKEAKVFLTSTGWEIFEVHEEFHERHFTELMNRLDDFSDTQLATTSSVLSVIEGIMNERMAELFDI